MQKIVTTSEQIKRRNRLKKNFFIGDYRVVAEMLNTTPDNVRTRFLRARTDVLDAVEYFQNNREELIQQYQEKISTED